MNGITLENLTIEEVNLVLAGLSELPTKSGAYPVAMKIKLQADAQIIPETPIETPAPQE